MNKSKLDAVIETAVNLKVATLKANNLDIYDYSGSYSNYFQVGSELFEEMFKNRKCEIYDRGKYDDYPLEYKGTIEGLTFLTITDDLLFTNEYKQEEI